MCARWRSSGSRGRKLGFPSPLVGEGESAAEPPRRVRGVGAEAGRDEVHPSSGASRHLLPQGEKDTVIAIIGAGPAGLIAAERLAAAGFAVTVYERMASPARKFLLAGRGGLNLTHTEDLPRFVARYGAAADRLAPMIAAFPPDALRGWSAALGEETFAGTSGRVFPKSFKATPLLRAWLRRLDGAGVRFAFGRTWRGWDAAGALRFAIAEGEEIVRADAVVLALGGASWPRLGSDGGWAEILRREGVDIAPLRPSNCGIEIAWSPFVRERIAGAPLKNVALRAGAATARGECVVTEEGLEGGAVYALGDAVRRAGATLHIDFKPDLTEAVVAARLAAVPKGASWPKAVARALGFDAAVRALLAEAGFAQADTARRAALVKDAAFTVTGARPIEKAISTAGGVTWGALDDRLMLRARPGVFIAGEMIDWDAPTGGYLLQACFASGAWAAEGVRVWLSRPPA
ncbi:MAG: TIGR03862 family flavoprotein [Alphaproteobacteria bacterium]|nr:TIGR03862 family flavoprotein [Alphaproteobacteria bacterium]